ncbi:MULTISPECIES: hypothetical protein [unclassified Micromonospora]|uniref:hypothetical protein n=1 Tax=unclassified Micromonospora TaxID=2617518 RepID=UPI001033456C|nr:MULTISPECIES: hypothetical protein [unclassified Micromonospora]QKW11444.1 hypothetical protein HUT12_00665 [Verrucosispora sp. NA02020]TBL30469.1 hypothetical protein EYA84_22640 [Verrucosispora sp. SN26_14.1]
MTARRTRCLAVLPLFTLLAGCSIGDIRRSAPEPPQVTATPAPVAETRTTRLAVPQRYAPPQIEFVDAENGYALFASCDDQTTAPDCPALLWSTRDGGRSWQQLRHPQPDTTQQRDGDVQQLYTAEGILVLHASPHGWWTSTDRGDTFRHTPGEAPPREWQAAQGRFQLIESSGKVGRWTGRTLRPLPVQPKLPVVQSVLESDWRILGPDGEHRGPVVAAGVDDDGRTYAALSLDEGRSWRPTPVEFDGAVGVLRVVRVQSELWLVGERPDRTGFPAVWRHGPAWERVPAEGHPGTGQAVPLSDGVVAVVSPRGAGALVGGQYVDLPWPLTDRHHLRILPDGTAFATGPEGVLLGTGFIGDQVWTAVTIETE